MAVLPLTYRFEPGAADDGRHGARTDRRARTVGGRRVSPGRCRHLREELITALIRSLPKRLAPQLRSPPPTHRPRGAGRNRPWPQSRCWTHCNANYPVAPAFSCPSTPSTWTSCRHIYGRRLPSSSADGNRDRPRQGPPCTAGAAGGVRARDAVADAVAGDLERTGLRTWPDDLDELPRVVERTVGGRAVRGFPAFVDAGTSVALRVFRDVGRTGPGRWGPAPDGLVRLSVASPVKVVERQLDPRTRLTLGANPGRVSVRAARGLCRRGGGRAAVGSGVDAR